MISNNKPNFINRWRFVLAFEPESVFWVAILILFLLFIKRRYLGDDLIDERRIGSISVGGRESIGCVWLRC